MIVHLPELHGALAELFGAEGGVIGYLSFNTGVTIVMAITTLCKLTSKVWVIGLDAGTFLHGQTGLWVGKAIEALIAYAVGRQVVN